MPCSPALSNDLARQQAHQCIMVYHYKCPLASNMIIFFNVHELTLSHVELPSGFFTELQVLPWALRVERK